MTLKFLILAALIQVSWGMHKDVEEEVRSDRSRSEIKEQEDLAAKRAAIDQQEAANKKRRATQRRNKHIKVQEELDTANEIIGLRESTITQIKGELATANGKITSRDSAIIQKDEEIANGILTIEQMGKATEELQKKDAMRESKLATFKKNVQAMLQVKIDATKKEAQVKIETTQKEAQVKINTTKQEAESANQAAAEMEKQMRNISSLEITAKGKDAKQMFLESPNNKTEGGATVGDWVKSTRRAGSSSNPFHVPGMVGRIMAFKATNGDKFKLSHAIIYWVGKDANKGKKDVLMTKTQSKYLTKIEGRLKNELEAEYLSKLYATEIGGQHSKSKGLHPELFSGDSINSRNNRSGGRPSLTVANRRRRLASRRRRLENRPIHRLLREIRRAQDQA